MPLNGNTGDAMSFDFGRNILFSEKTTNIMDKKFLWT